MKMRKASVLLVLMIVVSATFAVSADAQLRRGTNVPANTGFAAPRQFPQGVQTGGALGQGQAGGIVAPQQNFPTQIGPGQQQRGAGITVGDLPTTPTGPVSPTSPIGGSGRGGPGTCECIAAPCNCPGTGGGTGPIGTGTTGTGTIGSGPILTANQVPQTTVPLQSLNQPVQTQQFPTQQLQQPLQTQTFQGQQFQPQTALAGGIQPRQF